MEHAQMQHDVTAVSGPPRRARAELSPRVPDRARQTAPQPAELRQADSVWVQTIVSLGSPPKLKDEGELVLDIEVVLEEPHPLAEPVLADRPLGMGSEPAFPVRSASGNSSPFRWPGRL